MEVFICLRAVGGICFGLDLNCVSSHVCNMPWFVSLGGTHATHIPPVNDHLLSSRRRRHPSSTSHREPVVHGLFMVLFTQVPSVSSIVIQQRWATAASNLSFLVKMYK